MAKSAYTLTGPELIGKHFSAELAESIFHGQLRRAESHGLGYRRSLIVMKTRTNIQTQYYELMRWSIDEELQLNRCEKWS